MYTVVISVVTGCDSLHSTRTYSSNGQWHKQMFSFTECSILYMTLNRLQYTNYKRQYPIDTTARDPSNPYQSVVVPQETSTELLRVLNTTWSTNTLRETAQWQLHIDWVTLCPQATYPAWVIMYNPTFVMLLLIAKVT